MSKFDQDLDFSDLKGRVICLSGYKGSGKDTCANYLIQNYNVERVALADPLKDSVAEEFNIERSSLDDPKRKESPILTMPVDPKDSYSRMIAQFLVKEFRTAEGVQANEFAYREQKFFGDTKTGLGVSQLYWTPRALAILKGSTNRSARSDFWVDKAFQAIQNKLSQGYSVAVTDLRYQSEMIQFKEKFGDKVLFVRVNRFDISPSNDPSERDLDGAKFDYYVDNSGSIENTNKQVKGILKAVYFAK